MHGIWKDKRILDLDNIVKEVKQSEEWEAVRMNILEIGLEQGIEQGRAHTLIENVEAAMKNFHVDLQGACEGLGVSLDEYNRAKEQIVLWNKEKNPGKKYGDD